MLLIVLYVLLCFASVRIESKKRICSYATSKKPIGNFVYESGVTDVKPFRVTESTDRDVCYDNCRTDDLCLAVSFDKMQNKCLFYDTNDLRLKGKLDVQYGIWKFCNMSEGFEPKNKNRCNGIWVKYKYGRLFGNSYNSLENITTGISEYHCLISCIENELCGYVNHNTKNCMLFPKWPLDNLKYTTDKEFNVFNWTCVDNFVENLEIRKTPKHIGGKGTGYWEITSKNTSTRDNTIVGFFFQTQSFMKCLEECDQHKECRIVWYNVTYSICVLKDMSEEKTNLPLNKTTFVTFIWHCLRNDSTVLANNEDEKKYLELGMKCYRIENNKDLFIGKDNCGKHPEASKFYPCTEDSINDDSKIWNETASCFVNQSYWAFPTSTAQVNISIYGWMNLTNIYTGIQMFWLAYLENNNLKEVSSIECRSFNASRAKEKMLEREIVTRKQWQSQDPISELKPFPRRIDQIIISASQYPFHSYKTLSACIDILRQIQLFFFQGVGVKNNFGDIPYNFMIDENGNVFECRGWKFECEAVSAENEKTLAIAYIGWFLNDLPGEKFLNGAKKLIEYAVEKGYVEKNYKLYIIQDLVTHSKVHRNLAIVIKNWYRYRGFLPNDCNNYSSLTICLNTLSFLILCLLFGYFYRIYNFRRMCNKCEFLNCRYITFQQIYPDDRVLESLDMEEADLDHNESHIIIYHTPIFLVKVERLMIIKLINFLFIYRSLGTVSNNQNQNCLSNYLSKFPIVKRKPCIYNIVLSGKRRPSTSDSIMLCVFEEFELRLFTRLVKMKCCMCSCFAFYKYCLSKPFEGNF